MTCSSCGMPCNGRKCRDCERMEHQEDYYGTTESNWADEDGQTTLTDGDEE